MLKFAKHTNMRRNMQKCAKNMSKYAQISKDPKKYPKCLKMRKYHAKSQQNPDKRCPDPPQPREMEPVCSPDPSQTLQNGFKTHQKTKIHGTNLFWEGKSKDSWHESFFFEGKKTPLESPEKVSPAKIPSKTLPKSINFRINFGPSSQLCRKCGF